jgi:hypothetical protein
VITTAAFQDAPPPISVDGRLVVPLHIVDLTARVKFDGAKQTAIADAKMTYIVGPKAGRPFFDLRQAVDRCWLDGHEIDPALVVPRDVGAGPCSTIRVIDVAQRARSVHRLRIRYRLGIPFSGLGGAYPPKLTWTEGPRLRWSIAMSDLNPGRYLEAWFPSNLPFDHFPFALDLRLIGVPIRHTIITNGKVVAAQRNGWSIRFPSWFTPMSPLVEVRAEDQLQMASGTFISPISHRTIAVEAWQIVDGSESLSTRICRIKTLLAENETRYGEFVGEKYVCFFHGAARGMEYSNATTVHSSALRHEVFHSWFARGVMPASQADGWWDEGFTRYNDDGADKVEPFDFGESPVQLCSRQPFQRSTPADSYVAGSRFFRGVAAAIGANRLRAAMSDLYESKRRSSVSTATLEAHLIAHSGAVELVDAFHRFVYGFVDPVRIPRLVINGLELLDNWIPRAKKRGAAPAAPTSGHRYWLRARVRNNSGDEVCRHFVVLFAVKALSEVPRYPDDFAPAVAAISGFDLGPGETRIVSTPWPADWITVSGPRRCLLASVHARGRHPKRGATIAEEPALAMRSLTINRCGLPISHGSRRRAR